MSRMYVNGDVSLRTGAGRKWWGKLYEAGALIDNDPTPGEI
jgi:hypothetical protein